MAFESSINGVAEHEHTNFENVVFRSVECSENGMQNWREEQLLEMKISNPQIFCVTHSCMILSCVLSVCLFVECVCVYVCAVCVCVCMFVC